MGLIAIAGSRRSRGTQLCPAPSPALLPHVRGSGSPRGIRQAGLPVRLRLGAAPSVLLRLGTTGGGGRGPGAFPTDRRGRGPRRWRATTRTTLRPAAELPRGGGPRACLDAALSLRVSFCLLLCAGVRPRSPLCVFCLFKPQDGSLRGGGGRQARVRRWRLGPEQEPARNPRAGLGAGGRLQADESAEGADYGFVQPHSRPAELFHRQQIPVHLRRR